MTQKKKNKILDFSSSMEPKVHEKERNAITDKPLSKTKLKIMRFRPPKFT